LVNALESAITAALYPDTEINYHDNNFYYRHVIPIDEKKKASLKLFMKCFPDHSNEYRNVFRFWNIHETKLRMDVEYLYAHAVTQTVIYSAKDTNDYLSCTVHDYASLSDRRNKNSFIRKWMKEFGIGDDFSIRSVGGEAHLVYIRSGKDERVNLADKGMGSIQLMVLLFRLATILPSKLNKRGMRSTNDAGKVIIIEEPEQNLHPMLQSKLADLFFELNQDYGIRFIIETHSEYLIRRSQVIVGDNFQTEEELDRKNPFKVYYFPSDDVPYDMIYTTSGFFERNFGDGFFNEAGKLHIAVLRNAHKDD